MDLLFANSKKPKDIPVEHLDYRYVEKCTDKYEIYGILEILKSGKEGKYPDLEKHTEKRLLELLSAEERNKFIALTTTPSQTQIKECEDDIDNFINTIKKTDLYLQSERPRNVELPKPRNVTTSNTSKIIEISDVLNTNFNRRKI